MPSQQTPWVPAAGHVNASLSQEGPSPSPPHLLGAEAKRTVTYFASASNPSGSPWCLTICHTRLENRASYLHDKLWRLHGLPGLPPQRAPSVLWMFLPPHWEAQALEVACRPAPVSARRASAPVGSWAGCCLRALGRPSASWMLIQPACGVGRRAGKAGEESVGSPAAWDQSLLLHWLLVPSGALRCFTALIFTPEGSPPPPRSHAING